MKAIGAFIAVSVLSLVTGAAIAAASSGDRVRRAGRSIQLNS